jgi:type III pantothenate kinase
MKLIIDEGNTRIKLALFNQKDELVEVSVVENWQLTLENWLVQFTIESTLLCGVGSKTNEVVTFLNVYKLNFINFTNINQTNIKHQYITPETLGVDRIANAAYCYYNKIWPALVIDCGTCLKLDVIDEKGEYLGGAISPGLQMRCEAMYQFTAKLPRVVPNSSLPELIGNSSEKSLQAGAHLGMFHEIEQWIRRYEERFPNLTVLITGGDGDYFVKALKNNIFADPFLTLKGLNEILKNS